MSQLDLHEILVDASPLIQKTSSVLRQGWETPQDI